MNFDLKCWRIGYFSWRGKLICCLGRENEICKLLMNLVDIYLVLRIRKFK